MVELLIRDIVELKEMKGIEQLQREVWKCSDLDVVPSSELLVGKEIGGCLIGAFDRDRLAGFVFGLLGQDEEGLTIHSNMLAVAPAYRGYNLGYRLKLAQRAAALRRHIRRITWTFDPMLCLNAHLNFAKLGAIARAYKTNFFGETTASAIDRTGTDRLWVTWQLDSARVILRLHQQPPRMNTAETPRALECTDRLRPRLTGYEAAFRSPRFVIEIPDGWPALLADTRLAQDWRIATRISFTRALDSGYAVQEFFRPPAGGSHIGEYLLVRNEDASRLQPALNIDEFPQRDEVLGSE